jgi:hypothetical protein
MNDRRPLSFLRLCSTRAHRVMVSGVESSGSGARRRLRGGSNQRGGRGGLTSRGGGRQEAAAPVRDKSDSGTA